MKIQPLIRLVSAIVLLVAIGAIVAIAVLPGIRGGKPADQMSVAAAALTKPLQKKRCSDCAVVLAIRPLEGSSATKHYEIQLRMADGSLKNVTSATRPNWKAGDWVRLQNGKLIG
jgi:hypothetical protein